MRATRLFVAAVAVAVSAPALAGGPNASVAATSAGNPTPPRVEFTRPAGTPGSARSAATSDKYLLMPAQSDDPGVRKVRRKR
jgi:hypothetical protein